VCRKYVFVHNMDTERRKSLKSRKTMYIKPNYETNAHVRSILRLKSMLQKSVLKLWTTFNTYLGHYTLCRAILQMLRFVKQEYKHSCSLCRANVSHWMLKLN